ncbi:MAG: hypothetical protein SGBAC_005073, partial [Bacillariaceae sp.]
MGIYEFFATNYATTTAATANASDSRITGTGPQDFELSNESIPNGDSTSDSSDSDSARNHNSSHEFRMPFTDSDNTNRSSSSESEAKISLSESEKQSRSDGSNGSSSSGSGNSPQSKLMFDAWQNRGANSDASSPDKLAKGRASPGQASSRSFGSSSTESALKGPPPSSFDNGENSTAAGEASLQTTDTYGWSVPTDKSAEVLHPTARDLTEKMQNSKSSSSGSRTPQHENSGRNEASSSEEGGNQGSTSRVQPKTTGKISSSERSNDEDSASSSSSDDSSVPAGPIPLETNFKTGVVTEESFSSVSSSSSDESGWQSESHSSDESRQSKESDSRQGSKAKKESSTALRSIEQGQRELSPSSHGSERSEESSDKSGEQSSGSRRQPKEKKKSSTPLKRMEEARQERLSDSEGSTSSPRNKNESADSKARGMGEKKRSSNSSHGSSSSESHYEMKSDNDLMRSANALGAPTKRAHNDSADASKSCGSSSKASSIFPLPKPTIEKLKGGSSLSSSRSSASSSTTSKGSASSKSQNENSGRRSSGSSASSGTRSKASSSASPKPRGKKRGNKDSDSNSKGSLESFGSSSSSTSNSRAMMQSFGFVAPEDQVTSSDNGSSVSAKSAASTPKPNIEKAGDKSSTSSKSPGSSSDESPIGPPLPKRRSEIRSSKDSGYDSKSSNSTKPRIEKAGEKLSDSSSKSSGASSKVSTFGSPSPKSRKENVKEQSRSKGVEEVNNFALDKKLLLESDSSSSDADIHGSKEKPRPWSDFVPSPSTDPETKHTVDATARSEHDSDEFQWVPPSDTSGWVPKMRSRLGRDTRKMETQARVPHLQRKPLLSEAKPDVASEEKYKPDPPFGNEGSKANVLESSEMPLFYANIFATGTHRPNIENIVGNIPPVPPMDMKMRRKEYHGIPPLSEITVDPRYSDDSTLGTEGFHYAPFMMGGPKAFDQEPRYSSLNIRQLNPMPAVRMSEVLRTEGADPPEGRDRASSYLQFINTPLPPAPSAKSQEIKKEGKPCPSHATNVNFSRRPEEGENSWVPTQLKSALKSAGPIQLVPPKEDATLEDPKDVLYYQSTKPPSVKSNSAASNWNPTQISQSIRNSATPNPMQNSQSLGNHASPNAMAKSSGSFTAERLINSAVMDDDEESEEEISVEDEEASAYDEVTVASGPSEQSSRPASQMSEPESESEGSSSGSSYHPTGILDSSSSGSSSELYSARRSRLQAQANQANQRKPPIVTPHQRNQPSTANDLEDQRQPLNGRQTSKRPVALIRALIALLCLLLIIAAGVVAYFLTREDGSAPVVASVNPPTNSPTTFVPT